MRYVRGTMSNREPWLWPCFLLKHISDEVSIKIK